MKGYKATIIQIIFNNKTILTVLNKIFKLISGYYLSLTTFAEVLKLE